MKTAVTLAALLVAAGLAAGEAAAQTTDQPGQITLDMYFDYRTASSPQISPDGEQVVYSLNHIDKKHDSRESDLWIMNADGSSRRFLVDGGSPRWSPSGDRLAYVASGDPDGAQIFVRHMDDGSTSQITSVERSPSNVTWSPDGERIAFTMHVPSNPSHFSISLPDAPEGAEWTGSPRVITEYNWRSDGSGISEEGSRHIFTVDAEGGTPVRLTDGDWDHGNIEWAPDGEEILFAANRVPDADRQWRESNIYAVSVEDKQIRQLTDRSGPHSNPEVSPDGDLVAFTGYDWVIDRYVENNLYVMDRDGGNIRELAAGLDRQPSNLMWAADHSGVYFNISNEGTRNLYFAPLDGGHEQVTAGEHMLSVHNMTDDGQAVATYSDPHTPTNIVRFNVHDESAPTVRDVEWGNLEDPNGQDLDSGVPQIEQLTEVNRDLFANMQLGQVDEIWYESFDGWDIQGWIIYPPDFDPNEEYPMILRIHGGPHAMYNVGFNYAWQHHAAEGYIVLYTNPRGSSGYGSAFGNAIQNDYPGDDYHDLMHGVDELAGRDYIDADNKFVYGGSGGGVLTSWIVGQTDRFAAASVDYPVVNWMSFVGTSDIASWHMYFEEPFWEDPSEHLGRSPIMYVGNVETPTLLMVGENDLRTPVAQIEEYYQALKRREIPTAMVRFQDEWHGTSSNPTNFIRTQQYYYEWFERHGNP